MANQAPSSEPPDTNEVPGNAPVEHPGFSPRQVHRELQHLNNKFDHLTKPPAVRLADILQLAVVAIGIIVAVFTAMGLQGRMDDMRTRLSDAERRIDGRIDRIDGKIDDRFDRLERRLDQPTTAGTITERRH